jgi:phospholipid transport system transporter-binding protein
MLLLPETLTLREARDTMRLLKVALEQEGDGDVIVDAGALVRFDSSALAVLLECRRLAQAWGKRFATRSLPPKLGELARVYGIDELLSAEPAAA